MKGTFIIMKDPLREYLVAKLSQVGIMESWDDGRIKSFRIIGGFMQIGSLSPLRLNSSTKATKDSVHLRHWRGRRTLYRVSTNRPQTRVHTNATTPDDLQDKGRMRISDDAIGHGYCDIGNSARFAVNEGDRADEWRGEDESPR